jgi:cyclopropane fatty-acyl-phospholipid synthase-like methyltransferase
MQSPPSITETGDAMSEYWKRVYEEVCAKPGASLFEQVGKTIHGQPLPEEQLDLIVASAAEGLRLGPDDVLVDLCCGNGLVTERLARLCRRVIGIDYSVGLIEVAQRHAGPNVQYQHANALEVDWRQLPGVTKVVMNEALQHFTQSQFGQLLGSLRLLPPGTPIYIGGIPDRARLRDYYDTDEKYAFYLQREREGRPHMGRWWLRQEIVDMAAEHHLDATILDQKAGMVTAYYRFDVLLRVQA